MTVQKRAADKLRPVHFELDYVAHPEGSVLARMGQTVVLCNATVEERLPRWLYTSPKRHGWITAEYAMLPRSTHERTPRETLGLRGRTQEIKRLIGRCLRSVVDLEKLGERQIIVDCDVIQADGGTRTASVTGGYLALALAVQRLQAQEKLPSGVLKGSVAAVSVGLVAGEIYLDLDYAMDQAADVDLNVAMMGDGRYVEVQGTAEGAPFDGDALAAMLQMAAQGIHTLTGLQIAALQTAR